MRGVVVREHGPAESLQVEGGLPEPGTENAAVVRVRAVALNHLDVWVRRGVPGHRFPLPLVPGSEIAGVLESVPAGEQRFSPGDAVIISPAISCGRCAACLSGNDPLCSAFGILGESIDGGCRERVAVEPRYLFPKPEHLSFAEAAALPLDMLTAWHMLVARAQLRRGETVLIHAGGSGVGSAAIQIAKLFGATVYTTVGSPEKSEKAKALGADETILYREVDFASQVRKLTSKKGVEVVFEHVGLDTFEGSLRSLARGGRLVTCGATTGAEVTINLRLIFFKGLSILGSTMGSLGELETIMQHVGRGELRPVVGRVLPWTQIAEAHRLLENREVFGKVVLEVSE